MSSFQENQPEDKKKSGGFRRRRTGGGGNRRRAPLKEGEEKPAPRPKVDRPPATPFPPELIGKVVNGIVSTVVIRGRIKYGFIALGNEDNESDPRVYFNFENQADPSVFIRRGYPVEFVCKLDEQQRTSAFDVKLTEAGKVMAVEREAAIAQKKAERAAAGPAPEAERQPRTAAAPRERKPRPPREPREDRFVTLKVTCQGHAETKNIEFNLAQSVGKLKNVASTAFDAPVTMNVFHVTASNPEGEYLTKEIMNKMTDNDAIHLGDPKK
jgi:hypothetical protein